MCNQLRCDSVINVEAFSSLRLLGLLCASADPPAHACWCTARDLNISFSPFVSSQANVSRGGSHFCWGVFLSTVSCFCLRESLKGTNLTALSCQTVVGAAALGTNSCKNL